MIKKIYARSKDFVHANFGYLLWLVLMISSIICICFYHDLQDHATGWLGFAVGLIMPSDWARRRWNSRHAGH